jgi:alanine racemase
LHDAPGVEALRPTWYEIDLDAIAANFRALRAAAGDGVAIYACLKRNAYGCGAVPVARRLAREGAEGLALGNNYDAVAIRAAGVDIPILLYPTCLPEQAEVLRRYELTAGVSSAEEVAAWEAACRGPLKAFVKIDAGAFRAGALPRHARATFAAFQGLRHLEVGGAYGHFLLPTEDVAHAQWQLAKFERAVAAADELGIQLPVRMVAATAAVLNFPEMDLNAVDPGRMLYGVRALPNPKRDFLLRPALQAFEHLRVDLTDVPEAKLGDEVTIVGRQGEAEITMADVAEQWDLGPAEFYALLKDHVPRAYFEAGRMVCFERGSGDARY